MTANVVPALEVRNITKQFPGVLANDQISFTLLPGEIHAFLGENGAGKSTLMNILYGLYDPDQGEILINGELAKIKNPADAIRLGLGMVHQEYALVDTLTVTENIILGTELRNGPILNAKEASQRVRDLSEQYGLAVPPDAIVGDLPVGVQQRVEILKALYRNVNMLILDEPTAVLTPQEADDLFRVMRELADQGKALIFITHKLREVREVADRITVLRRGKVVGGADPKTASEGQLAALMVGRDVVLKVDKTAANPGDAVLKVRNLKLRDDRGLTVLDDVSLDVHAGEVLGIAGVQGNGQTELVEAITGLQPLPTGSIELLGKDITNRPPRSITEQGVAYIPEDRKGTGLVLGYSIRDNLVLSTYYKAPFTKGLTFNDAAIDENAQELIETFDVRTPSATTTAGSLSGGNQQKIIVAREFTRENRLLIASQPTRGIDVGSIEFIHNQIIKQRDAGLAVLLVSAELDEILSLADRVAVMYHGKIVGILPIAEATRERVGLLMAGIQEQPNGK